MDADYNQFPGGSAQGVQETWLLSFQNNGEVILGLGGVNLVGDYSFGTSESIAQIASWFRYEDVDDQVVFLSTSLALSGRRLEGPFSAQYGETLQNVLEELNGTRFTTAAGTLSGHKAKSGTDESTIGEALRKRMAPVP